MAKALRCVQRHYDSKRKKFMFPDKPVPGDLKPTEPAAKYYEWPPGTEVYHKKPGSKTGTVEETTRVVPGGPAAIEAETAGPTSGPAAKDPSLTQAPESLVCDLCGKGDWPSKQSLMAHRRHCEKTSPDPMG